MTGSVADAASTADFPSGVQQPEPGERGRLEISSAVLCKIAEHGGDARQQLRTAYAMFTEMGAGAFAERTRRELQATGVTARRRPISSADQLTEQEAQIARLARDGLTNPEIGARLFISPRTVEYHLHKVFTKLAISSRTDLPDALTDGAVAWRGT